MSGSFEPDSLCDHDTWHKTQLFFGFVSGWALDLPLLHGAELLRYTSSLGNGKNTLNR